MDELSNVLKYLFAEGEISPPANAGEFEGPYPGEAGFEETKNETQDMIDEQGDFTGGDMGGGGSFGGGIPEDMGGPGDEGEMPGQKPQQMPQGKDYSQYEVKHDPTYEEKLVNDDDIDFTRLMV